MPIKLVAPIKQATGSVKYDEPQTLTAAQQSQARDNINAADKYNGLTPVECAFSAYTTQTFYVNSEFNFPDYSTANDEIKNAMTSLQFLLTSTSTTPAAVKPDVSGIAPLVEAGVFGDDFWNTRVGTNNALIMQDAPITYYMLFKIYVTNASIKEYAVYLETSKGYKCNIKYSITNQTFGTYITFNTEPLKKAALKIDDTPTLSQLEMAAAPTKDMQIATKKYVDDAIKAALAQQ